MFKERGGGSELQKENRLSPSPPPRGGQAAAQQTAGVWVVVNHPEMSLFRGLNEAPTTKGGPACSRTACPPAPDAHNSFIQEPHVHTKAPEINPTSRHPGQCPESSQNPRLKRGDSIQGRSNRRPATESQHERKTFFFFSRRGSGKASAAPRPLHSGCAGLTQPGHTGPKAVLGRAWSSRCASTATMASARLWPARATVRLGLGLCAAVARVNLRRRHFPLAPARYSRAHTHANVPPEAA